MKNIIIKHFFAFILVCSVVANATGQYIDLFNFNGTTGKQPGGSLVQCGSAFYGMTYNGGVNGDGNIFSIASNGSGYSDLFDFNGTNGGNPIYGSLTVAGNRLFGMTYAGGTGSYGVLFSIQTNGTGFTDLINNFVPNGAYPFGSLTLLDSTLYGMTYEGGLYDGGNIFSISTSGLGLTNVFNFDGTNGFNPVGNLTVSGGKLFGMTQAGGTTYVQLNTPGCGIIFSINTDGTGFTDLFNFNGNNGQAPHGSLTISGSTMFGMTEQGGISMQGNLFSISTDGTGFTDMLDFTGTDGLLPSGTPLLVGNNLYGITLSGGSKGDGLLFSIKTDGSNFSDLNEFNGITGQNPLGSLILVDNRLYGMTSGGGIHQDGVIFSYNYLDLAVSNVKNESEKVRIYPNPGSTVLNIELNLREGQMATISLYNSRGDIVKYETTFNGISSIALSDLPSGIYYYRITDNFGNLIKEDKQVIVH